MSRPRADSVTTRSGIQACGAVVKNGWRNSRLMKPTGRPSSSARRDPVSGLATCRAYVRRRAGSRSSLGAGRPSSASRRVVASKSASSSTIGPDLDALTGWICPRHDRGDLEVLALVHEAGRLVQRTRRRALAADLEHDLVPAAQAPFGDDGGEQGPADSPAAESLARRRGRSPSPRRSRGSGDAGSGSR